MTKVYEIRTGANRELVFADGYYESVTEGEGALPADQLGDRPDRLQATTLTVYRGDPDSPEWEGTYGPGWISIKEPDEKLRPHLIRREVDRLDEAELKILVDIQRIGGNIQRLREQLAGNQETPGGAR